MESMIEKWGKSERERPFDMEMHAIPIDVAKRRNVEGRINQEIVWKNVSRKIQNRSYGGDMMLQLDQAKASTNCR